MSDKNLLSPAYAVLAAIGAVLIAPAAGAAQELRIGLQAAAGSWEEDLSTAVPGIEDQTLSADGGGVGVVAQYVVKSDEDTGFFIGFEGALTQQDASDTTTVSLPAPVMDAPPLFSADVTGDIVHSVDLLWFGGYDFGMVSAYAGVGPTIAGGEGQIDFQGMTLKDEATHIGWKYGAGVEVDLGSNVSVIARASYAGYRNRAYTAGGFPIAVDVEPRVTEVRVGVVYRVNVADVLGAIGL